MPIHFIKEVPVALTADNITVNVGDTVNLLAVTPRRGDSFANTWSGGAVEISAVVDKSNYVSTAAFTPVAPGSYVISYNIELFLDGPPLAVNDRLLFTGHQSITITANA